MSLRNTKSSRPTESSRHPGAGNIALPDHVPPNGALPPPPYSSRPNRYNGEDSMEAGGIEACNAMLDTRALLDDEGRIELVLKLREAPPDFTDDDTSSTDLASIDTGTSGSSSWIDQPCPPMNIVIFIVGSRGDVQPYLALAIRLIETHSHRVRIATHGNFKDFVLSANKHLRGKHGKGGIKLEGRLEHFDAGGDPKELMAYMVKNPGLLPGLPSLVSGEIGKKRRMTAEMLRGFYKSTFWPDPVNGEFAADAILSNPPAFAHISVAEALGIPLVMTFTMPWTATRAYSHPLVVVKESNAERGFTNVMSYTLADLMIYQGLGDVVNQFRESELGLEAISDTIGPGLMDRLRVPWTYCWNEGLLPRPRDWKNHIDISGFYFWDNGTDYTPDIELITFLKAGRKPIYIGFGSVVIPKPVETTAIILEAIKAADVRAILHAGWAGLGKDIDKTQYPDIYFLNGDVPHDWLFAEERVAAVCHHGGAGTTAIGLREGCPTIIIPFFGDQRFWGDAVNGAGAGPPPIPFKELTAERLAEAFQFAVSDEAREAAGVLGKHIREEDALQKGLESFHRHLPLKDMVCDIDPGRVAVWWSDHYCLVLSAAAAGTLVEAGLLDLKSLKPYRSKEWEIAKHDLEPFSAAGVASWNVVTTTMSGVSQLFYRPIKGFTQVTYGTIKASFSVIGDFQQGLDNIPKMIGSPVREVGKVDSFSSGLKEGGKALGFGFWDGIAGLFTEPVHGAFQEGPSGIAKGVGRSYVNLVARPAAGVLGFFTLPWQGGYQSIRHALSNGRDTHNILRGPRESAAVLEARLLTQTEKNEIIEQFNKLKKGAGKRRRKLNEKKNRAFLVDRKKKVVVSPISSGRRASDPTVVTSLESDGKVSSPMDRRASDIPSTTTSSITSPVDSKFSTLHYRQRSMSTSNSSTNETTSSPISSTGYVRGEEEHRIDVKGKARMREKDLPQTPNEAYEYSSYIPPDPAPTGRGGGISPSPLVSPVIAVTDADAEVRESKEEDSPTFQPSYRARMEERKKSWSNDLYKS